MAKLCHPTPVRVVGAPGSDAIRISRWRMNDIGPVEAEALNKTVCRLSGSISLAGVVAAE
jgi:hypothetical protein